MNIGIPDLTITSIETIDAFSVAGEYRFTLDELHSVSISNSQDKDDVTGKGGRKLNSLKKNKGVTIKGTNGLLSSGLMEAQVGSSFGSATSNVTIRWSETLSVSSNAATTTYKGVGTSGAEIIALYKKNTDGSLGDELEQAASTASGKFTYTPGTKALAFNAGEISDNAEIYVVYNRTIQAPRLSNASDKYSEKLSLFVNAFAEDPCSNVYRVQIEIPRADFSGEFELSLGDGQATHSFEAESLAGSCGAAGNLWNYTVFGTNTADVA